MLTILQFLTAVHKEVATGSPVVVFMACLLVGVTQMWMRIVAGDEKKGHSRGGNRDVSGGEREQIQQLEMHQPDQQPIVHITLHLPISQSISANCMNHPL